MILKKLTLKKSLSFLTQFLINLIFKTDLVDKHFPMVVAPKNAWRLRAILILNLFSRKHKSTTRGLSVNFHSDRICKTSRQLEGSKWFDIDNHLYSFIMSILSRFVFLYLHYFKSSKNSTKINSFHILFIYFIKNKRWVNIFLCCSINLYMKGWPFQDIFQLIHNYAWIKCYHSSDLWCR